MHHYGQYQALFIHDQLVFAAFDLLAGIVVMGTGLVRGPHRLTVEHIGTRLGRQALMGTDLGDSRPHAPVSSCPADARQVQK